MRTGIVCAIVCASAFDVGAIPMASQEWTRNRLNEAKAEVEAEVKSEIYSNVYDKAQTDARIIEIAPISGLATKEELQTASEGLANMIEAETVRIDGLSDAIDGTRAQIPTNNAQLANGAKYVTESVTNGLAGASITNGLATSSVTNGLIGASYIATNNPAFVEAVTNCPVAIAASDAEALTEWGIYGVGGTIGALLAALAAAVAALKKKKMPLYPVGGTGNPVNATIESGVLTISPFGMAAYTPTANAAFSVGMGALPSDMEAGKARDAVLVIDCSSLSEGDEPTVTWGTNFHPRTDAGTDFACVAGAKNVYYISEYAPGDFAVGGWTETAGGNA